MSDYGWNNGIGSYSCGKNIGLRLKDSETNIYSLVAGKLSNYDTWLRSSIDDIYMVYNVNNNFLNIFQGTTCEYFSYAFPYEGQGGYTQYSITDLNNTLIGNDQGRSVMVPPGYQVDLYEHENLAGAH